MTTDPWPPLPPEPDAPPTIAALIRSWRESAVSLRSMRDAGFVPAADTARAESERALAEARADQLDDCAAELALTARAILRGLDAATITRPEAAT